RKGKSSQQAQFEGRRVLPPVPADDDWSWTESSNEGNSIASGHQRREAFPHDAAKARNADNRFTHAATPRHVDGGGKYTLPHRNRRMEAAQLLFWKPGPNVKL